MLPLSVTETDVVLADPVAETLQRAIRLSNTGYAATDNGLAEASGGFAARRWSWHVDGERVSVAADVSVAMVETLRAPAN